MYLHCLIISFRLSDKSAVHLSYFFGHCLNLKRNIFSDFGRKSDTQYCTSVVDYGL